MNDKFVNSRSNAAPSIVSGKKRTRFDVGGTIRFTCNTGDFVPFYCKEVLPDDTWDMESASLTRLETSLHQTMDNAYLELAFFYVPNRIVMNDWDKLLGANDDAWARNVEVSTPQLLLCDQQATVDVAPQSLLNQLMLPAGSYPMEQDLDALGDDAAADFSVTQLPLRDVFQIYNDWFRDESVDSIVYFSKGNSDVYLTQTYLFNGANFDPAQDILKVNRFRDRFSSALPAPQKGNPVTFGIGGFAPVVGASTLHSLTTPYILHSSAPNGTSVAPTDSDHYINLVGRFASNGNMFFGARSYQEEVNNDVYNINRSNLVADLSSATAVTVNDLRLAIAAQVLSEQEARGGTRLNEVLFSQWNLKVPSLMIDRSEYLGGKRIPLQMLEVLQTSETGTTVLGSDAGHSKTFDANSGSVLKSFMFHGYIIGVAFIRTARSYSQGIDRQFYRKGKYTYYNPIFDNIGEVPVKKTELLLKPSVAGQAFGYQEAWYEYKEGLNRDAGYMQTGISGTLDTWHYGDKYVDSEAGRPLLSPSWMKEDANRVDRTIAVSHDAAYQWSCFINVEAYATRLMNKYSVPNSFGFGSK